MGRTVQCKQVSKIGVKGAWRRWRRACRGSSPPPRPCARGRRCRSRRRYASPTGQDAGIGGSGAAALNTSTSLQQNLTYRIGRLSFNANAAVINVGARTSYTIFGSVNREFNGFFDGRW